MKHTPNITTTERIIAIAVLAVTLNLSFPQVSRAAVPATTQRGMSTVRAEKTGFILAAKTPSMLARSTETVAVTTIAQKPRKTIRVLVTAYNSLPEQTDGTPYVTAKGTFTRDGVVAANFLPFGTTIRIPDHFGAKAFTVEDRMNTRFSNRIDIWVPTKAQARAWGARMVTVEVL